MIGALNMPRRFHFSLQKVLDFRIQLEEQAKEAMAKAQNRYQAQVQVVQKLRDSLAANEQAMYGNKDGNGPTPHELWLWRNYAERLQVDLQVEEQKVLQRARELNTARRELVNRSKDRKLLEKHKQNQMVRHVKEEEKREQNELDEMATLRYGRNAF